MPTGLSANVVEATLPRFQQAARYARLLLILLCWFSGSAVLLFFAARRAPESLWQTLLLVTVMSLLVLVISLQSAWWVCRWRARSLVAPPTTVGTDEAVAPPTNRVKRWLRWCQQRVKSLGQFIESHTTAQGKSALLMALLSLLILGLTYRLWRIPITLSGSSASLLLAIGAALAAFGLLVLERYLAGRSALEFPEATYLTPPLRVAITVLLIVAACLLLDDPARTWLIKVVRVLALLPAVIAGEYLLRAMLSVFTPANPHTGPDMLADSLIAGMWRWPLRPLHHLHNELQQRFGIDLRQNWAFGYVRRALLPVTGALLVIAWLLSAITEIPVAERGIYERFGKPVAVWAPGLHVGLPWPFARVRSVELGVVHELATASAMPEAGEAASEAEPVPLASADGPPPVTANRLWDASHVAEKSQVIASRAGERESFHVVNMDVRFIYRIGLDDASALAATYSSSDVPTLIRSTANRVLVRYFASRTLDGVLGEARKQLAIDVGTQVQADLIALNSGVEILATVIEAIHPPAAAANAYHSVQAAQIRAQAIIARERGSAAEQVNVAQMRALMASAQAEAGARETVAAAEASQLRFAAERDAFAKAGKAFLFEQYLAQLGQGLSNGQLVIIDHRLRSASPTIDLRPFGAPLDPMRQPATTQIGE